jgi:uncharacterized protein (UPF0128 family)
MNAKMKGTNGKRKWIRFKGNERQSGRTWMQKGHEWKMKGNKCPKWKEMKKPWQETNGD